MLSFARCLALNARQRYSTSQVCSQSCLARRLTTRNRKPPYSPSNISMQAPVREKALKMGIDAAVEDFVKTGMNICIGDGAREILVPLLDKLAIMVGAEGLIDVAFVATNQLTSALLEERNLPSDLAVNFKTGIDLFIAPVTHMDEDCNAVLDSRDFAADRFAASLAGQVVVIIHEDDFQSSRQGLTSMPVQLPSFLPGVAAESLCKESLTEVGVRGCTVRSDGSNIADISLAPGIAPRFVAEELERSLAVIATGFLASSKKTTVVLATNNLHPIDMTPPLHSFAKVSKEEQRTRLTGDKREELLRSVPDDWQLVEEPQDTLCRKFSFKKDRQAQAFVRYVHHVSAQAWHHPDIKQSFREVHISITTHSANGLTKLDGLFVREVSRAYAGMKA